MIKYISCPECGAKIPVAMSRLGRKRLNIPVTSIYDALCSYRNIAEAAKKLGYIYGICKEQGKTPRDVFEAKARQG